MLEITNLVKKYNENSSSEQIVLNDCFFKIEEGEKVIITGENGSGKTTLLKIVGLLDKNFYGKYLIDGNNIDNLSNRKIAELRNEMFGFIFQEYNLLEEETVYENIVIPLIYSKKYNRLEKKDRIYHVSEILEIKEFLNKKVKFLSGGERQRVAIARAIINDPKVLILDEPTNALNPRLKAKVISYIEKLGSEKSLILVTHGYSLVELFNWHHYEIIDGKLIRK